jgi:hypothetical protein
MPLAFSQRMKPNIQKFSANILGDIEPDCITSPEESLERNDEEQIKDDDEEEFIIRPLIKTKRDVSNSTARRNK